MISRFDVRDESEQPVARLGFFSRQAARARQFAFLAVRRPHYLLGRFAVLRSAWSGLRWLQDRLHGGASFVTGDLYKPATVPLQIARSGRVSASKSPRQQAEEIRSTSWSAGLQLDGNTIAELQASARTLPLVFNDVPCGTYEEISADPVRRGRFAIVTVRDSSALPAIRAVSADTVLYEAARQFLGYRPRRVSTWFFWSLANDLSDEARRDAYQTIDWHYDVDGMNFLYANFYLLDTTARSGAHALIEGSSRRKNLRNLLGSARLSDAEAVAMYGRDCECTIEGPAGSGFFEDTSCYHKALAPRNGDRLMLQLRYQ